MKHPCFYLCLLMVACQPSFTLFAEEQTTVTNTILNVTDFSGLAIKKHFSDSWCYISNGNEIWAPSVAQVARHANIEISLDYAELSSFEEAKKAVEYTINNAAAKLKKGIWKGATQQKMGDLSWYGDHTSRTSLFVVSQTTCFSVTCFGDEENVAVHRTLCEQLALKIVEKIEQGGKVLMPDGTPPPQFVMDDLLD